MDGIQVGKEVTAPALGDNLIMRVGNLMKSTKKLPELIIEQGRIQGASPMCQNQLFPSRGDEPLGVAIKK